jgi:hypothetical protein
MEPQRTVICDPAHLPFLLVNYRQNNGFKKAPRDNGRRLRVTGNTLLTLISDMSH